MRLEDGYVFHLVGDGHVHDIVYAETGNDEEGDTDYISEYIAYKIGGRNGRVSRLPILGLITIFLRHDPGEGNRNLIVLELDIDVGNVASVLAQQLLNSRETDITFGIVDSANAYLKYSNNTELHGIAGRGCKGHHIAHRYIQFVGQSGANENAIVDRKQVLGNTFFHLPAETI